MLTLMPVTLPGASILILLFGFSIVAAFGTNKNPTFAFFNLYPVHGCIFLFTKCANFCFHFLENAKVNLKWKS